MSTSIPSDDLPEDIEDALDAMNRSMGSDSSSAYRYGSDGHRDARRAIGKLVVERDEALSRLATAENALRHIGHPQRNADDYSHEGLRMIIQNYADTARKALAAISSDGTPT